MAKATREIRQALSFIIFGGNQNYRNLIGCIRDFQSIPQKLPKTESKFLESSFRFTWAA